MKQSEVFFYQGNHSAGADFYYNSEENTLSVVTTHSINFDNDEEGLHLKKLDQFEVYKTLTEVTPNDMENGCNTLLAEMDNDFETVLKF